MLAKLSVFDYRIDMKHLALILLALFTLGLAQAAAPTIKASAAVVIAEADLEERGLYGKYFPESINLKSGGPLKGETYWEILWNDSFPAQTKGRNEIGIRVKMDGTHLRIVR